MFKVISLLMILNWSQINCNYSSNEEYSDVAQEKFISPLDPEILNGKVKSFEINNYVGKEINGNIEKINDTLFGRTIIKFDDLKRKTETIIYTWDLKTGSFYKSAIWNYLYSGNYLKEIWQTGFDKEGGEKYKFLLAKYDYKVDTIIEHKRYGSDEKIVVSTMVFDKNAKKIKTVFDDGEGSLKYDNSGNLIYQDFYKIIDSLKHDKKVLYAEQLFKYDDLGNRVEWKSISYEPEKIETILKFSFEFDKYKNWIKQITYFENGVVYIDQREIKYE